MRRFLCAIASLLVLTAATAFGDTMVVKVGHNRLDPSEVTIEAGSTVTFFNEDQMPGGHTIVADDGSFESPGLSKGEEWSHTFESAGTYTYSIKEHPSAQGKIIVK